MWQLDNYYYKNIRPIIEDEIIDFIDLGNEDIPDFDDLSDDVQNTLAAHLFFSDGDNFDPLLDDDLKIVIKRLMTTIGKESNDVIFDLANIVEGKIANYYRETITELLNHEYKEVYDEYVEQRFCEEYKYDRAC